MSGRRHHFYDGSRSRDGGGGSTNSYYRGAEIAPPPNLNNRGRDQQHHHEKKSSNYYETYHNYGQKRTRTEEEYFNEDDEEEQGEEEMRKKEKKESKNEDLPYIPAPGSPSGISKSEKNEEDDDDDDEEEDPLDAFMANLEKDAASQGLKKSKSENSTNHCAQGEKSKNLKGVRQDIDELDDEESYYKWLQENPDAGKILDEHGDEIEYDEDGNPIAPPRSRYIDPLPPIDHSKITYQPFEKNFYEEHPDIAGLSPVQIIDLKQKLDVHISGIDQPKPVSSFAHFGFDEKLMKSIRKSEFTSPTPIQSMGIPAVLSGRDVIGIAKTGSGKTAAFLWPMLAHIMDQRPLNSKEGPIALVLAPTRELAMQIFNETRKFGKIYNLRVVCAYGGGSKWEQSKAFETGAEIAIATPGRMIDMIKMKVTNLERVTYLVLDEADRMFDMGFEPQVRSICDHVRPDRQTLLFSATFKKKIERLCRDILLDPVKIVQGSIGEASDDVTQIVKVMQVGGFKWNWVTTNLVKFMSEGSVLIFVTKKANCEELAANLKVKEFDCKLIHGDLNQIDRNEIIHSFKKQEFPILVATDVAARGLDIPHIRNVINYDVARDIDTHTHRIGRTGRAGIKGTAYTLVTEKDKEFVGHIVRNLEGANQRVSDELMDLAMQSSWFKNSRSKKGFGSGGGKSTGLGFKGGKSSGNANLTPLGPAGGGRYSAVKQAFKNQFMSNFQKASSSTEEVQSSTPPSLQSSSERKKKIATITTSQAQFQSDVQKSKIDMNMNSKNEIENKRNEKYLRRRHIKTNRQTNNLPISRRSGVIGGSRSYNVLDDIEKQINQLDLDIAALQLNSETFLNYKLAREIKYLE